MVVLSGNNNISSYTDFAVTDYNQIMEKELIEKEPSIFVFLCYEKKAYYYNRDIA